MELLRKNIHTERTKARTLLQVPLEEDINISDAKPDVARIIHSSGRIKIDEIKLGMNKIWVKGRLDFQVMYEAEPSQDGVGVSGMDGELPFTEEIFFDKLEGQDRVTCRTRLDDFRVQIINSRKLSVQAVISLEPKAEETASQELCTEIDGLSANGMENGIEYRKKELRYLETAVKKKDLLRIHEEVKLPAGMPDIGSLIWKSIDISRISFRASDERLAVDGEMNVFIVYGTDSTDGINWYEAAVPFSGSVECQNSRDGMLADVSYSVSHEEMSVRDNSDGEPRIVGVECALELEIKVFEEQQAYVVADVYGTSCEVSEIADTKDFQNLLAELDMEEKLSKTISIEDSENKLLQICHCEARAVVEEVVFDSSEVRVTGAVELQLLYSSNAQKPMLYPLKASVPFELSHELPESEGEQPPQYSLDAQVIGQTATIKDSTQLEWRGTLSVRMLVYENKSEAILGDLKLSPIPDEVLEGLPGFAIYCVANGDSLWQIGKKYYVGTERIKEINGLDSDTVRAGDRPLIVNWGVFFDSALCTICAIF